MKKASKVLSLILVAAMLCALFTGCVMFGKDSAKYRQSEAFRVGDEIITVGKVIDTFNSNYRNNSMYINAGYMTIESLLDGTIKSLYNQAEKIDAYKKIDNVAITESLKGKYKDAEYLTEDELAYIVTYVKYMVYSTVDSIVEDYVGEKRTLKDKTSADTSRDFKTFDDLRGSNTYAEYLYAQNFYNEDMDEYIENYYQNLIKSDDNSVGSYVYENETQAAKMLEDLNARLEKGDEKITFAELKVWQEKALKQYNKNVQSTYGYSLEELVKTQVEDVIFSVIVAKYNYNINKTIEGDNKTAFMKVLEENYEQLKKNQTAKFNLGTNFVQFIEGLGENDNIFSVPAEYKYIFVKNILIPFSANQKAVLANLAKDLGSKDNDMYIQYRESLAGSIVADDFLTEKDDDGNYGKVNNVFKYESGKLVINPDGELAKYFNDGVVTAMDGKTKDETIIELMKRFNTDTAQHKAAYDYVVRVGEVPSDYKAQWVTEFVDAANEAWDNGNGLNSYALAVSDYGVHIVYYTKDVAAQTFDFTGNYLDTSTREYNLFKTYFETQANLLLSKDMDALHKSYVEGNKITKTANFDRFLKDNGMKYDFKESLKLDDEDK